MKILIVSGGRISDPFAKEFLQTHTFDQVIAADAGLEACHRLGILPTVIMGDFDSLKDADLLKEYRRQGIPVREYPSRKDDTDTELALHCAEEIWSEGQAGESPTGESPAGDPEAGIWLLGATGSRLDHTLSNIGLLVPMADRGIPCRIIDEHNEMEVLKGPVEKTYERREELPYFSILAINGPAEGIDLSGFSYPLYRGYIPAHVSVGISNEITEEQALLRLREGYLLVVRSSD